MSSDEPDDTTAGGSTRWTSFWFQEIPPHVYALLRIGLGGVGLVGLLGMADLPAFWWPYGLELVPPEGFKAVSVELGLGRVVGTLLYAGSIIASLAMVIGYRASVAVPLVFVAGLLHTSWNNLPLGGAAQAHRAFVFCLMWIDTGEVWSLDSWLLRREASRPGPTPRPTQPIWPLRLVRFQMALIYLNSGFWKLTTVWWRDGSALYYVMNGNEFPRFDLMIPPRLDWIWTVGSYLTLGWELAFGVLLLHPWSRRAALGFGVLVHLTMWLLLELGTFSFVMLAGYLAFLDPSWVSRILTGNPRRL